MSAALERRERARQARINAQIKAEGLTPSERCVEAYRYLKAAQEVRAQAAGLPDDEAAAALYDLARSYLDRAQIFEGAA